MQVMWIQNPDHRAGRVESLRHRYFHTAVQSMRYVSGCLRVVAPTGSVWQVQSPTPPVKSRQY